MTTQARTFTKKLLHLGKEANSLPHDAYTLALLAELNSRIIADQVFVELGHPRLDKLALPADKLKRTLEMDQERFVAQMTVLDYRPETGEVFGHFRVHGPFGMVLDDALAVMQPEQIRFGMRALRSSEGKLRRIVTWDLINFDQGKHK